MGNTKDWAIKYANEHLFRLHPLNVNGKNPLWKGWPDRATLDEAIIAAAWEQQPNANIGIATGEYGERWLLVIDGDRPHGNNTADGVEYLEQWQRENGKFPETVKAQSAHGGIHYYFWTDAPYKSTNGNIPGVDTRCEGGYIVAPPSQINGKSYQWVKSPFDTPIAAANSSVLALLDKLSAGKQKPSEQPAERSYTAYTAPAEILEGQRVNELMKLLGSLQAKGLSDDAIRAAVQSENEQRCNPPLSDDELETMVFPALKRFQKGTAPYTTDQPYDADAAWILSQLQVIQPEKQKRYSKDDAGSGYLFADLSRERCRYVAERKDWYFYNGECWKLDEGALNTMNFAKAVARALLTYAAQQVFSDSEKQAAYIKYASKWHMLHYRETVLKDAATVYPLHMADFDSNDYLLNCPNGTLDMKQGLFREHRSGDLITQMVKAEYKPDAVCPRWIQFIDEVTRGDKELARFIQKVLGYTLTGDTSLECFFILYGATTRNGKGTLCETFLRLMGDYATTANPESLATRKYNDSRAPSEDLARLAGKRFVNVSEPAKSMILSVDTIKKLTGSSSETVTARFLGKNSFTFKPRLKIIMDTNHLPTVTDATLFSSDRVRVIPFNKHFGEDERNPNLKAELCNPENLSGILNWCIEGYKLFKAEGLKASDAPEVVKAATQDYEEDGDRIGQFVHECLTADSSFEADARYIHSKYQDWCNNAGFYAEGFTEFKKSLATAGIQTKRKTPKGGKANDTKRYFVLGYNLKA